jgi:O-Antigen ligase
MGNSAVYFYNSSLRWGFGFENPNKAAVIFACLLPLLFMGWNLAWDLTKSWWLKISAAVIIGTLIFADALCLFKTYSRGGSVAAIVAVLYLIIRIGWQRRPSQWTELIRSVRFNATSILVLLLAALFLWVGLGERLLEPITTGDASVGHRLVLWQSALQMAAENPVGFGEGKSGEAYMQWYQDINSTSEYRTMVNSYLTFLIEQGWLWFAVALLATTLFWFWSLPGKPGSVSSDIAIGFRASILAFLVSGIFSTIMEEPVLWVIPVSCALILAGCSLFCSVSFSWRKIAFPVALTLFVLFALYLGGLVQSHADPLSRKFTNDPDGRTASELAIKKSFSGQKTWVVVPDPKVLGPCYGKLLRQLVIETGVTLKLESPADLHGPLDRLLLVGNAVKVPPVAATFSTILLAPAVISEVDAQAWSTSSPHLTLVVPSIDEDRRVRFWRDYLSTTKSANVTLITLNGVGLRVDWNWEDVINLIKKS